MSLSKFDFDTNRQAILKRLADMKLLGYDRIHIPGGTSKDGGHYSGVIIPAYDDKSKTVYFCGLPYDSNFHKRNDENGHTKKAGESAMDTAIREVTEETALSIEPEDLIKLEKSSYDVPDKNNIGARHYKNFYWTRKATGHLFSFPAANPIDGETAAPIMIPADLFLSKENGVFYNYRHAVLELIDIICKEREYAFALMNSV